MHGRTQGTALARRIGERHPGRVREHLGTGSGVPLVEVERTGRAPPGQPAATLRQGCAATSPAHTAHPCWRPTARTRAPARADRAATRSSERQIDPWLRIEALMLERTRGRRRRRGPLALLLDKIDEFVTERADARAREMGLDIRRVRGTRTQVYRDRRWDSRQECGACAGTGISGARSCRTCAGTGVVVTDPAAQAGEP